jgi:DNA-binding NarL/FixJ family response regulator
LTTREREILKLIAEGKTNGEIAILLHVSIRTVENHRASIMNKLNLRNVAGLVRYAIHNGLV